MATGGQDHAQPERPEGLAALLRTWRKRALLTQEELANRAGLSIGTVRGLESGRITRPHKESQRLLADGLGLSTTERAALTATARRGHQPEDGPDGASDRADGG